MGKAILPMQLELLKAMFLLPEDFQIISAAQDAWYESVNFLIESPEIPDVSNGALLPRMSLHVTVEQHPDNPDFRKFTVTPMTEVSAPQQNVSKL